MPIDIAYSVGNAVTITNTETSLAVNGGSTTLQTITDTGSFMIKLDAVGVLAKGDDYLFRFYEKATSSSSKVIAIQFHIMHAMSEMIIVPAIIYGAGWDATLQRISATSRAWNWSINRVS